jgi:hypothetical protein
MKLRRDVSAAGTDGPVMLLPGLLRSSLRSVDGIQRQRSAERSKKRHAARAVATALERGAGATGGPFAVKAA